MDCNLIFHLAQVCNSQYFWHYFIPIAGGGARDDDRVCGNYLEKTSILKTAERGDSVLLENLLDRIEPEPMRLRQVGAEQRPQVGMKRIGDAVAAGGDE